MVMNYTPQDIKVNGKTPLRSGAVSYTPRALKKPSHHTTVKVFGITIVLLACVAGIGLALQDMRFVIAAIYFAFGFVMQRASFCSSALISAVVLSKDFRGLEAIFVSVLTGMLGFGLMQKLGWITIYPGSISILPAAVAGTIFGVGMVFAGGCISGSLFKAAEGRFPSILAVIGIFAGIAAGMSHWGQKGIVTLVMQSMSWNPPPNLLAVRASSFPYFTVGIALVGLTFIGILHRRRIMTFKPGSSLASDRGWPLLAAAIIIGMLGWAAFLAGPSLGRNYPLGATHIPRTLVQFAFNGKLHIVGLAAWTFIPGAALSAWMRGKISWRTAPRNILVMAFLGGVMVGLGAVIGQGCFVGQVLSGWALLSSHALIFGCFMIVTNLVTTLFYLRGWR